MKKNISEVSLHEKDTGSSEVQIALLTDKIETFCNIFVSKSSLMIAQLTQC